MWFSVPPIIIFFSKLCDGFYSNVDPRKVRGSYNLNITDV